jgi:nicotinamide-nucleotide amidase
MASAEIITIGTEILLGEIVDTNARAIARNLRDIGVDLYRKTTVGDNTTRIAQAVQQAMERCDIIITTGGLGPTVDDPTREAVALAMGVETEFRPELWDQIQARFKRFNRHPTENNKRQAYVPCNATAVENPVGTAPAFIVETGNHAIISLPGVPREMEYLMENAILPYLRRRYQLHGIIKTRLLHAAGAGESQIDDLIGDLEILSNPTVGLAAHSGQVDVRITAKAGSEAEADLLIAPIEKIIRERLGEWIYGSDLETLEQMALQHLTDLGWSLGVVVDTHCSEIIPRLAGIGQPFQGGEVLTNSPTPDELQAITLEYRQKRETDVALGLALYPGLETQDIHVAVVTPIGTQSFTRPYGGPPKYGPRWAINHSLDIIRNLLP